MARTRSTKTALAKWLDTVSEPVYAVDDRRRILYMNAACADWIGIQPGELIGRECRYHSSGQVDERDGVAAALCPPPESIEGRRISGRIYWPRSEGRSRFRQAEFVPLVGTDQEPAGVIVFVAADETAEEPVLTHDEESPAELHARLIRFRGKLKERFQLERFVGESPAIKQVRAQAMLAAGSLSTVFFVGPRGSGCRELARVIHYMDGPTSGGPLVAVDCAIASSETLQAALDSLTRRYADEGDSPSGTLVLEDVGQMPAELQTELFERLRKLATAHRVIATSRELPARLFKQGHFPAELAAFLSTLVIQMPPLRERLEDLPLLVQSIIEETNQRADHQMSGASPAVLDQLAIYPYSGDVAELREVVVAACKAAEGTQIQLRDLPERVRMATVATRFAAKEPERIVLDEFLGEIERELISRALAQAKGNKTLAADLLGMNRPRLYRRMVQLEFEDVLPDFQPADEDDVALDDESSGSQ